MIKKIIILILEVIIIISMVACSLGLDRKKNFTEKEGTQNLEGGVQRLVIMDDKSAMQHAYAGITIDFTEYGSDVAVRDIAVRGNQVYVLLEVREWRPEPEDNAQKGEFTSYYQVFTCRTDGSQKMISEKIYLPEDGGYVNTMQLSDDGCVAALFYSEEENTVKLLFCCVIP